MDTTTPPRVRKNEKISRHKEPTNVETANRIEGNISFSVIRSEHFTDTLKQSVRELCETLANKRSTDQNKYLLMYIINRNYNFN